MNLILLKRNDFVAQDIAVLSDLRFDHIRNILKLSLNDTVKVGLTDSNIGSAKIVEIDGVCVKIRIDLNKEPPKKNPAILFCALPRPKVFRRVLLNAVTFGVKEIHFFHASKVEKSYWQTPFLSRNSIDGIVENALMQAVDTVMPKIYFHKSFRIFAEEVFAEKARNMPCFLFHPSPVLSKFDICEDCGIVIGAEGGFSDYEIGMFGDVKMVSLGERILRVEQAVSAVLGRFYSG